MIWGTDKYQKKRNGCGLIILCLLAVWFFIPPLCGVYFFPPYNEPMLSGERGMGVIVLNKQKAMIFVLGHPSNTYTLHGLQSRKNGVEICNAKPLPIPIYIHNYFFFLTYYEEWDNPQSRVCWTLPIYLPVQFVESIIQYYYCRYICGDDSSELLGDYSRHYPLLPTWLFITSIIIQIVLLIWGVSKILCYYSSYCIGRKTILGKREHGEITKDDEL